MPGHFNDEGYGSESSGSTGTSDGGGVDTGDHDGDEQYGSDTGGSSSRSKVSPENSPGHPANAPTGSTRSTGPGAGGPSVGGGGGGSSQGNENSPGHPANAPGGSSSRGNVSPENSPGHPANAPTGSTDSGSTGAGTADNSDDIGRNRLAERVAEALNGQGMTHTEENNVAVSRDSNGYVVVRTLGGGGSALYRADGSMVRANDRDLMIGFNDLQEVGVPMISTVTPANAGDAWASHKSIVDEALASLQQGGTPVELSAAAARVERIAAAWRGSGVTGEDGTLMADQLEALAKTLSGAADGRTYRGTEAGTVTPANSAVAWAAHQPVITQSIAILNEGGTSTELAVAAAEVARIAAAWRGSGVTAEDGGLMANHLDGLAQSLSESSEITQANYDQRAEFENVFREVTKREPSGDLVKDADILSRYGENAVTDMDYAGEVQAFENVFRDVTKREPSGDLVKDADILSRYGENAVTDMGYAGEVQAFENVFRDVTKREPSGDLVKDADILSRYGENAVTDMGYAGDVQAFEKVFRDVTGREPSGDLVKDADILSRYGENAVTDMGYAGDVQAETEERQEKERRVAHLEGKFRDEVSQIGDTPGAFVGKVLDSQIEGGGLPTNHPDFAEYDQLRTDLDGPHWRREQIAKATGQLLDDSTIGTIDIGPAKDAVSALVKGRHVSNYDSSIPVPLNAGMIPVVGTLADANVRGADGYSRGTWRGSLVWVPSMCCPSRAWALWQKHRRGRW